MSLPRATLALAAMSAALSWGTASAQDPAPVPLSSAFISSSGVFSSLSMNAESAPSRSEAGHGAMMSWADRLWIVTYLSVSCQRGSHAADGQGRRRLRGRAPF